MADPLWTGYVGMVTGIIGAITGVAGAIMGYVSYRRSNEIKSLDLRLELRKSIKDLHSSFSQLKELLVDANNSRAAAYAKAGLEDSGAMAEWKKNLESDENKLTKINKDAPKSDGGYDDLSPNELEDKIVDVHQLQNRIKELSEKYVSALKQDDELRKAIARVEDRRPPRS